MTIRWSFKARDDLLEILRYIGRDDPTTAFAVIDRIESAVDQLEAFPGSGRPGRLRGTRELVISDLPYVVPYRVSGESIDILRILHAARKWPGAI